MDGTRDLSDRLDAVQADLQALVGDASAAVTDTRTLIRNASVAVTDTRTLLRNVSGVVTDNRAGLAEIVRRLHHTVWHAELALRKIRANPAVLLFGDEESDYEAAPLDETGIRRSGRVKPYGQRDEKDAVDD